MGLQEDIDRVWSLGGGELHLGGTYVVESVRARSGVVVVGHGATIRMVDNAPLGTRLIYSDATDAVEGFGLCGVTLDGGIQAERSEQQHGVFLNNAHDCSLVGVRTRGFGGDGVYAYGGSSGISIRGGFHYGKGASRVGYNLGGADFSEVVGCTVRDVADNWAVKMEMMNDGEVRQGNRIVGNRFIDCRNGVALTGPSGGGGPTKMTVAGNVMRLIGGAGMFLRFASHIDLDRNTVTGPATAGAYLDCATVDVAIRGNTFSGLTAPTQYDAAIQVGGGTQGPCVSTDIVDNVVADCGRGLLLRGTGGGASDQMRVQGNRIHGCDQAVSVGDVTSLDYDPAKNMLWGNAA